jgi:tetraacyldisaccharide 4'-kinase
MDTQAWLQRIWYGGVRPPVWLRALSALHSAFRSLRPAATPPRNAPGEPPVVVVGNLTVGGTGKTPLVIWLCGELQALGLRVAVISRGYGGTAAKGTGVLRVDPGHPASLVGDEPLLVRRRTGVPVYVAQERSAAAAQARGEGAQVIIADDGLQHAALARSCEIVVVDGERGLGNGLLLPAGPLREPAARLAGVSAIVVNGGPADAGRIPGLAGLAGQGGGPRPLRMRLVGDQLVGLGTPARRQALSALAGRQVHAVAAIGNPGRFFQALRDAGLRPIVHPYRDHAPLPAGALAFGDGLPVLMSEKDAVKCAGAALPPGIDAWVLPVEAQFGEADGRALLGRVLMDARLLELLACPVCKGPLRHVREPDAESLLCRADRLAFPVRDGIPVMLEEEARVLPAGDPLLER